MAFSKPPIDAPIVEPRTGRGTDRFNRWLLDLWNRVGETFGVFAPKSAKYITQTHDADLTNEQALADLSSGFVKVTTGSGVLSSTGSTLIQSSDMEPTLVTTSEVGSNGKIPVLTFDEAGRCINANEAPIRLQYLDQVVVMDDTRFTASMGAPFSTYVGVVGFTTQNRINNGHVSSAEGTILAGRPLITFDEQLSSTATTSLTVLHTTGNRYQIHYNNYNADQYGYGVEFSHAGFNVMSALTISETSDKLKGVILNVANSSSGYYNLTFPPAPPSSGTKALLCDSSGILSFGNASSVDTFAYTFAGGV